MRDMFTTSNVQLRYKQLNPGKIINFQALNSNSEQKKVSFESKTKTFIPQVNKWELGR